MSWWNALPGKARCVMLVAGAALAVQAGMMAAQTQTPGDLQRAQEQERQRQEQADRARRQRLDAFRREQQERADRATRERNRAVEEGASRAAREYYGTARGSRSQRGAPTRRPPPPVYVAPGSRSGLNVRCKRWLRLCRQGRRKACRLFDENC